MRRLLHCLRHLFQHRRFESELAEEMRFHREMKQREFEERGAKSTEAGFAARRALGSLALAQDRSRDVWLPYWLQGVGQDLRLAVRTLRATPIVTAVAILSLALGIGANTAIFSLLDSLTLRTLPVKDPARLVLVTDATPGVRAWSSPVWNELRQRQLFEEAAAWSISRFNLASGGETQFVDGLRASGSFFTTLGVQALIGRTFSDADDQPTGGRDGPVAVISYRFWQRYYGGAADIVGRTLALDGMPFTVIGVTPPAFFGMEVGRRFDVAAPLGKPRGATVRWLTIVGRLKAGQTIDAATVSLRGQQSQIRDATLPANASAPYRQTYLQASFTVMPAATGSSGLRRQYEQPLVTIMAVVGLVMLIACANVANLLLARATARRHEFSVRLALGASRWRLARPVLAESVLLASCGAALGVLIASAGSRALVRQLARETVLQSTTVFLDLSLNWHVLAFTMSVTVFTVLLFGVAPAFRASSVAPMETLKEGRGTVGDARGGLSSGLVVAQVALSVVLVVAAGLFVRTFTSLVALPLGFEADRVLVVNVSAQRGAEPAQRIPTFERALNAADSLPNVVDAAASLMTPVSGLGLENRIEVSGATPLSEDERAIRVNHVSPGWFRTLGIPLLTGRDFTDTDRPGSPSVAIVNEAFARTFLNGASPLGHTITGLIAGPDPGIPIVGMARDAVYASLRDPVPPTVYLPFAQSNAVAAFGSMSLSVRSNGGSPVLLNRSLTAALTAINPDLTWTFRPLTEQIGASITQERLTAILSGFFGALALLLAGLGLYGVTAYGVARRRTELGIRMALGAAPGRIVRLVLSRVSRLVGLGVVIGAIVSLWLSRFVAALLYGVGPRDPITLSGSVAVLAAVAALAGWLPAWRASRIDPAAVLREQ